MARQHPLARNQTRSRAGIMALNWEDNLERVTGIEPALSAWEMAASGPLGLLTCRWVLPPVPAIYRSRPWLIAR
jgi:hypothetical protein